MAIKESRIFGEVSVGRQTIRYKNVKSKTEKFVGADMPRILQYSFTKFPKKIY